MLPGSSRERVHRGSISGGRTKEIQRLVGRALRAVVDLDAMGEATVRVDCDVLQADGGTRTAAITGAWIALHDAMTHGVEEMGLAEANTTVEEKRVVAPGRILGDGAGRGVGELVRAPYDE